jgi:hypothetical protein
MSIFNLGVIVREDLSNGKKKKGKGKAIPVTGHGGAFFFVRC